MEFIHRDSIFGIPEIEEYAEIDRGRFKEFSLIKLKNKYTNNSNDNRFNHLVIFKSKVNCDEKIEFSRLKSTLSKVYSVSFFETREKILKSTLSEVYSVRFFETKQENGKFKGVFIPLQDTDSFPFYLHDNIKGKKVKHKFYCSGKELNEILENTNNWLKIIVRDGNTIEYTIHCECNEWCNTFRIGKNLFLND